MNKRIYLTGDDIASCQNTQSLLQAEGFYVEYFENGSILFEAFQQNECALVILDVVTATADDFVLCAKIRHFYDPNIIILSAQMADEDFVSALTLGVDNCLTKPFSHVKLVAYIRALLIKSELLRMKLPKPKIEKKVNQTEKKVEQTVTNYGDLTICSYKRTAHCNGKELKLTNLEFNMLTHMLKVQDKAISREELRGEIWGSSSHISVRVTDDTIKRLRQKLTGVGSQVSIENVWGFGFRLGMKKSQKRHEAALEYLPQKVLSL